MAVVVAHGVDPRLQDQARVLIKQLGDVAPKAREAAEAQLFEMGPGRRAGPGGRPPREGHRGRLPGRADLDAAQPPGALTGRAASASSGPIRPSWSRSRRSNCSRVPRNSRRETSPSRFRSILRNQAGPTAGLKGGGAMLADSRGGHAAVGGDREQRREVATGQGELDVVRDLLGGDPAVAVAVARRDPGEGVEHLAGAELAVAVEVEHPEQTPGPRSRPSASIGPGQRRPAGSRNRRVSRG